MQMFAFRPCSASTTYLVERSLSQTLGLLDDPQRRRSHSKGTALKDWDVGTCDILAQALSNACGGPNDIGDGTARLCMILEVSLQ